MMDYDIAGELRLCLYSLIVGGCIGCLLDIFRLSRCLFSVWLSPHTAKPVKIIFAVMTFIEDVAFFAVSAIVITVFVFHNNYGDIRGFSLICTLCGFVVYYNTFGRLTYFLSGKLALLLKALLSPVIRLIRAVWAFICRRLSAFVRLFGKMLGKIKEKSRFKHQKRVKKDVLIYISALPELLKNIETGTNQ